MFRFIVLAFVFLSCLGWGGVEEAVFMKAIRADIHNKPLRTAFGVWLERNGQPERGKFIQLLNSAAYEKDPDKYEERLDRTLDRHFRKLFPRLPERFYSEPWYKSGVNFYGLGGMVILDAKVDARLLAEIDQILADDSPVLGLKLELDGWQNPSFRKLLDRASLKSLSLLQLDSVYFDEVEAFVGCQNLSNLSHLTFGRPPGIFAPAKSYALAKGIATSRVFSNLKTLRIPLWPMEGKQMEVVRDEIVPLYLQSEVLAGLKHSPLIHPGS